jgi:toxin ParE1/3/4
VKIRWLNLALTDLDNIFEFITEDNPTAARKVVRQIWESVEMLKDQPKMGRPGRVAETRELIINNTPFIVPYRVKDNTIQILRVIHSARKWPATFNT